MTKKVVIDLKALLKKMPADQREYLRFQHDAGLLSAQAYKLAEQYPDQWAGMFDGKVTIAPTYEELLEKMGENAKYMAWAFLSNKPINLILLAA